MKLLSYIWALPVVALGLPILLLMFGAKSIKWSDGCLEIVVKKFPLEWMAALTCGFAILYENEKMRLRPDVRVHERVHVEQVFRWGILFPFLYFGEWLFYRVPKHRGFKKAAYHEISFEQEAYRIDQEFSRGIRKDVWGADLSLA